MNKRVIFNILLVLGVIVFYLSFMLTSVRTTNKNIIGGADYSSFCFVFFNEKHGFYFTLACLGIVMIVISAVFKYINARRK